MSIPGPQSATSSARAAANAGEEGLEHRTVPFLGSLAQSVGLIAPSAGVGLLVAAVVGIVGPLSWVSWLIGTVMISFVAWAIVFLTRRFSTTGGLYALAGRASGSAAGYFVAFGALLWLIVAAPAIVIQAGIYFESFLNLCGISSNTWSLLIVCLACLGVAGWLVFRGIRISLRVLLAIEATTIALLLLLMFITLAVHHGGDYDPTEFSFKGVGIGSIILGITLVTFAFGGFESATVFGEESQHGRRNIPWAVMGSIVVVGIFYTFCSFVMTLGYSGSHYDLATTADSMGTLAIIDGARWLGYVALLALTAATFANTIAVYNAGARMVYTLGRERVLPSVMASISKRTHAPRVGIFVFGAANLIAVLVVVTFGFTPFTAFSYLGTVSGYGAIVMYAVTCLAVMYYVSKRSSHARRIFVVVPLIGAGIMAYGLYTQFVPFPAFPGSVLVWIFAVLVVGAVTCYALLRTLRPARVAGIGQSVEEWSAMED